MQQDLTFSDWRSKFPHELSSGEWTTLYFDIYTPSYRETIFSVLIDPKNIQEYLKNNTWDIKPADGVPEVITFRKRKKLVSQYVQYGNNEGIEPLVFIRRIPFEKDDVIEINQEIINYFNLRKNIKTKEVSYTYIDDNGDDEIIIEVTDNSIKMKTRFLSNFMAIKNKALALYFDLDRLVEEDLNKLQLPEKSIIIKEKNTNYQVNIFETLENTDGYNTTSRLMGKYLIKPSRRSISLFPTKKQYVKFIVGCNSKGVPVEYTCDPEKLSDVGDKNTKTPSFLARVYFKPEVLSKYYSDTRKYSVEDGYLRCSYLWGLRLDNSLENYVSVFLGDLGESLSYREQQYWKLYNVVGDGRISKTSWSRNFGAEFADPQSEGLFFKQKFNEFNTLWREHHGWDLFLPLNREDSHNIESLRCPLNDNIIEFEQQVLALTKILIDSINVGKLKKFITVEKDDKSITILKKYFIVQNLFFSEDMYTFLRNLQSLRSSGFAHRKGTDYEKSKERFGIGKLSNKEVFKNILIDAIKTLNSISHYAIEKRVNSE